MLVHHTMSGCNLRAGDLIGTGTISGPTPDSFGSMLELSWRGSKAVQLEENLTRKFIENGDTIILRGTSERRDLHPSIHSSLVISFPLFFRILSGQRISHWLWGMSGNHSSSVAAQILVISCLSFPFLSFRSVLISVGEIGFDS